MSVTEWDATAIAELIARMGRLETAIVATGHSLGFHLGREYDQLQRIADALSDLASTSERKR